MAKRKQKHWTEGGLRAESGKRAGSTKKLKGGVETGSDDLLDILLNKEVTEADLKEMEDLLFQEEQDDFIRKGMDPRLKDPLDPFVDPPPARTKGVPASQADWNEGWRNGSVEVEAPKGSSSTGAWERPRWGPKKTRVPRSFLDEMLLRARGAGRKMGFEPGPLLSRAGGSLKKALAATQTLKGGFYTALGGVALEMAPEYVRGLKEDFNWGSSFFDGKSHSDEMLGMQRDIDAQQRMMATREARIKRLQQENVARIMQFAPDMAQTLLAGEELPEDAVVIGGKPRTDLLQQVARDMAQGRFPAPQAGGGLI